MKRTRLVGLAVLAVAVVVLLAVALGGGPETALTVSNEGDDLYVVEVYQVGDDATVLVERDDGTTETVPAGGVETLANVSAVSVPANRSRTAVLVFENGTATANATATGSRFVYAVHDGDPDGRTYLGVGVVDCGDGVPSANLTIRDGGVQLEPDPCT